MRFKSRFQVLLILASTLFAFAPWHAAYAIPSFARQTGLWCTTCHTAYPALTAFGRQFKLGGYTFGTAKHTVPPLALLFQPGFTHTSKDQPGLDRFGPNDNGALSQASIFYGGRIYGHFGAFVQTTLNGVDNHFSLDNTDIRYGNHTTVGGKSLLYGFTLNNNPSVQDPWNTLPAWGYPYASSDLAPGQAAGTLLDGGIEMQVAGLGGYALWNNLVYAGFTGYKTLSRRTQSFMGINSADVDETDGIAPYWRLALQKTLGKHYVSLGTFGLIADTYPGRDNSMGSDRRVDVGIDSQYQFTSGVHNVGLYFRWIHEKADWTASQPLGNTSNAHDTLDDIHLTGSYLYDHTYGLDLRFNSISGGKDATLYGSSTGSPDTQSLTMQANWLPFNKNGGPKAWKWFNPKFAVKYTKYFKFDGSTSNYDGAGRDAADNDTLYVVMWAPF